MRKKQEFIYSIPVRTIEDADLSPASWPEEIRLQVEKQESAGWLAAKSRLISGKNGLVATIASPIAVQAGLVALQNGGSAADAAATIALTQITTQLGSVASFAGIMSLIYFDAKAQKVYSMDAGFNSYLNETDPMTIPASDLGSLGNKQNENDSSNDSLSSAKNCEKGRLTLVPGFMAGIEAMHNRFGKLPFAQLFEPAIWYAKNGTIISPVLAHYFTMRHELLTRTPEGQEFLQQHGKTDLPIPGDRFFQPQLAEVLSMVARRGCQYMYTGPWGKRFVKTVKREGGKAHIKDMSRYKVIWSEPYSTSYLGKTVYTDGYQIVSALNFLQELGLEQKDNYWTNPEVMSELQLISDITDMAPWLDSAVSAFLREKGISVSPEAQLSKEYAKAVVPWLAEIAAIHITSDKSEPRHSDSIVVIDNDGNIAALTHTINCVIWGGTGIVVDGIPIPDSAGFQQHKLAAFRPGDRVANELTETIIFDGEKPIMATAAIGSSLAQETMKVILGVIGKRLELSQIQAAPPLLYNFMLYQAGKSVIERGIAIPEAAYEQAFVERLQELCETVHVIPSMNALGIRGTVVAATIDPVTGTKHSCETKDILVVGEAY